MLSSCQTFVLHIQPGRPAEVVGGWNKPDAHVRPGNSRQLDGARETLVSLRIIVLEADLELDRLEEISLLLILRVVEKLLHILAHSGYSHLSVTGLVADERTFRLPTVIFDMMRTVFQKNW
jgi:hypothetical protein